MTTEPLILAIDQGTTNTKAILVDRGGAIVATATRPMPIEFPRPGWVEQDATTLWQTVRSCIDELLDVAEPPALAAIGISNQRETGLAWERSSGRPVGPAVSWQCHRSADRCEALRRAGHGPAVQATTGLPLDAGFTAGKWAWLLEEVPDGRDRAADGDILVGTVDAWLLWNLTGSAVHATDVSNASRTQLMDLSGGTWDRTLAERFGVPSEALPRIDPSSARHGETVALGKLPAGVPIGALVGDSHAALFGHAGFTTGSVKATYGTGSSLMMATASRPVATHGLAATVAWGLDTTMYALEGNIYVTGAAVQWVADFAGLAGASEVARLAETMADPGGIYLVPAFVGLGAPHWDEDARGLISGLTRGSTLAQLALAALESIAYQVRDVFEAMRSSADHPIEQLLADGGVTRNGQLMQLQADVLGVPVQRNDTAELSALGAAYLAGLAVGTWATTAEIDALPRTVTRFVPRMSAEERARRIDGWREAVARTVYRPV